MQDLGRSPRKRVGDRTSARGCPGGQQHAEARCRPRRALSAGEIHGHTGAERGLAAIVAEQEGVRTMHLPCREVFARGGRPVAVAGPADLPEATAVHEGFWG
jgi:hypothetical protein